MATSAPPYIHRDLSWLSFNYRVLQEAKDPAVPLFERLKFLAIYSNNLDEYFRVRVANHRNLIRVNKKTKKALDFDPKAILKQILATVNEQQLEFSRIFEQEIIPELADHGIRLLRRLDLSAEQKTVVEEYFQDQMLPFVQPVLLVEQKIRPFLANAGIYFAVSMRDRAQQLEKKNEYAIVKIPSDQLPRFLELPSTEPDTIDLIMLDDIVRHSISWMFPGYEILDAYSIKLTRDAELYIDDEYSGDLIGKIKNSLAKRHVGPASRFVYDREMPTELLSYLMETFDLTKFDLFTEGRYHNNFDFFKFPTYGMDQLKNPPLPPQPYPPLENTDDFFGSIAARDHLVHFPYQDYESVVRFFEAAAADPDVTHIKIVQYRVARKSRIMKALTSAVKAGKQVFVFIEVKARFDEEANLRWGEKLEEAGVTVNYSFPGVKVHSKLALVRRVESGRGRLYSYFSTGNFHEDTAKIYSDFGLFTADRRLTGEMARVFKYLETSVPPPQPFEHLLVGQFNLRPKLRWLIDREIANAKAGKPARIVLKVNSIQDVDMIHRLYAASRAGVKVDLIVRGICSIVPGRKGWSENISAISIVDRFLEHARVFIFHNEGEEDIYLSSADWMTRNLSHRVETTFPLYDPDVRKTVRDLIGIQLFDNVKARIIDEAHSNEYRRGGADMAVRSQLETYYYLKRQTEMLRVEEEEASAAQDNAA